MFKYITLALVLPITGVFAFPDLKFKPPAQKIDKAIKLARAAIPEPINGWEEEFKKDPRLHYDSKEDKKFISECICTLAIYGYASEVATKCPTHFGMDESLKEIRKHLPIMKDDSQTWFIELRHPVQNDVSFLFRIMRDGKTYKLSQSM